RNENSRDGTAPRNFQGHHQITAALCHPANAKTAAAGNEPFRRRRHQGDGMSCKEFQESLYEYLDSALPPSEMGTSRRHLDGCKDCREAVARETQISRVLSTRFERAVETIELKRSLRRRIALEIEKSTAESSKTSLLDFLRRL